MKKINVPAVKKANGKVVKAKSKQQSHADLKTKGERGFEVSDGTFANREEAAKVAAKARQIKSDKKILKKTGKLHSSNLRKKKDD
jgi:hypothetical protein